MPRILTQFVRRAGCRSGRDRRLRRGFTLIELMISIAIVLILMLGINYVFSTSSKTIGTGLALSAVTRDMRNARSVMQSDFDNAKSVEDAGKMPAIIIQSEYNYAFMNKKDRLSDNDGNPAT